MCVVTTGHFNDHMANKHHGAYRFFGLVVLYGVCLWAHLKDTFEFGEEVEQEEQQKLDNTLWLCPSREANPIYQVNLPGLDSGKMLYLSKNAP